MIKTLSQALRMDKERFKVPKSVQQAIPIQRIWPDGIFQQGTKFSKTYRFTDINYYIASKDNKTEMFLDYSELLNSLDSGISAQITINNRRINKEEFEKSILLPMKEDGLDHYREEYNEMLLSKITGTNNSIYQERYLTVSVHKRSIDDARTYFARIGTDIVTHLAKLSSTAEGLDAESRLQIFRDFFKGDVPQAFPFDLKQFAKKGTSFKDWMCPDSMEFERDHFKIGDRYGRVLYMQDYASYVKDDMISELCDFSRNLMLSIDILPVPTDEAVREIQNRLLGVETNVTNWQRRQNANNNFSAIVPYDMELQRKETKEMLDDLTTRDQRMMFGILTMVHLADSKKQLDSDTELLLSIARKHLCQMATLKWQQVDGLNTVLPYGLRKINALRTLTTESTAVLIPFHTQEILQPGGIYYGQNAVSKNLLVADRKKLMNGNSFRLGVSGSGKSFSAKEEIVHLALSTDDDILILDPESEFTKLVEALGGQVVKVSATSDNHLNAMDMDAAYGNASYVKDDMISELCDFSRNLMLSIDILPVPTDEAVREIQNRLLGVETNVTNWQRRQNANNNFSAIVPYDMELQRKETKEMLDDLTTRDQRMMFGILTMVHLADSKKQLDSDTELLLSIARKHLCQMATLKWQQVDGLNTVLPYGLRKINALRTLTTESTAVLIPFHTQEILQPGGIYYGQNAVSKNLLVADRKKLMNGNSFRLGVSGSGKSFSAKEEIVHLALSTDDDILILDPESEFTKLVEALGGQVVKVSATSDNHLNAMDMDAAYGNEKNPLIEKSEFILSVFEQLVGAGNLSAKEKSILDRCAADVYRDYIRSGYTGEVPTLKDMYRQLMLQPEEEARGLALSSELFINGSLNTFAQPTNVNKKNRIMDYDIRELGEQLMPLGMLVTLDSIFNRVIQNWKEGKTTWIFADEFYLLFRYEYSANFFYRLYKRIRKYNGFVTGLTQNVEELLKSDTARLMLANSEFLILLNQASTDREELAALLNISENQLSYITNVSVGSGLIRCSGNIVPFENTFPKNTDLYKLMTTKPGES